MTEEFAIRPPDCSGPSRIYTPPFRRGEGHPPHVANHSRELLVGSSQHRADQRAGAFTQGAPPKAWGRQRVTLSNVCGYDTHEWQDGPAQITILIDNLEKRLGRWLGFGLGRDAGLAAVVFFFDFSSLRTLWLPSVFLCVKFFPRDRQRNLAG